MHPQTRAGARQRQTQEAEPVEEREPRAAPSSPNQEVLRSQGTGRSKTTQGKKDQHLGQAELEESAVIESSRRRTQPPENPSLLQSEGSKVFPQVEELQADSRDAEVRSQRRSARRRPPSGRGARGTTSGRGASATGRATASVHRGIIFLTSN